MDAIFEERQRAESAEKRIKELEEQIASLGFIPHGLNVNENDTISTNPDVKEEVSTMPEMSQVIFNKGFSVGADEKQSDAVRKLSEYFMKENPEMTTEQATKKAETILT